MFPNAPHPASHVWLWLGRAQRSFWNTFSQHLLRCEPYGHGPTLIFHLKPAFLSQLHMAHLWNLKPNASSGFLTRL
jgi:hypothetical protein